MQNANPDSGWTSTKTKAFWSEIACSEHVLHIYGKEEDFINILAGFTGEGINAGESIIVIATDEHLNQLDQKLTAHGIHLPSLVSSGRYFPLVAYDILDKITTNGWPDESKFWEIIGPVVHMARANSIRVRAFGEMVALLWRDGRKEATLELEHLWNKFSQKEDLQLFCAYPQSIFEKEDAERLTHICHAHSKIIRETGRPIIELLYMNT